MDCKTARQLLDFARPQARELEPDEAGELESHLDRCADCHGAASRQRQLDDCLGRAMRLVEVPAGLRDQILTRLESERGDWYRGRFARTARWAVAAAAVLVLGWAAWHWIAGHLRRPLDPEAIARAVQDTGAADRRVQTEAALKRLGVPTPLSPHLNYNLLIAPPSLTELPGVPGQRVAMLVFARDGRSATVYLVPAEQLPGAGPRIVGEGTVKVEILPSEGEPYSFLVVHEGDNLDWLQPPEPPAA
jgi:hypothetical protein